MNEPDPSSRRSEIAACFKELHLRDDEEVLNTLTGLWNIALAHPDDSEFATLSIFESLAKLIERCIKDREWLIRGKNICISYYAAHIIGSYTMNKSQHAELAAKSGVISPLMELLRGKISWVEKRVAVRALGHLASHKRTFEAISAHEEEIINLAMKIASTCIEVVFTEFVSLESETRLEYHRHLMTKGVGGFDAENNKAEEWASQLQCWSLYLLNCFAIKNRSIDLMCKDEFLKELCAMRGGLENQNSFAGLGLIRSLCHTEDGRKIVSSSDEVILSLCNLSRSSDNWQFTAIDSLLLLLKDLRTRQKVIHNVVHFLADLLELRNRSSRGRLKVGDMITQVLLQDYSKIKYGKLVLQSENSQKALEEVWDLKVERRKMDKMMSEQEVRERKLMVRMLKREGNEKFWCGDVEDAVKKYTKGLDLCPLKLTKERIVLYSNRAQCYLLLKEAELAISDTTRALCLCGAANPHLKSLWRRSQAYDMKGQALESLMDCSTFINERSRLKNTRRVKIPYYAMRMLNKQMNATWLFKTVADKSRTSNGEVKQSMVKDHHIHNEKLLRKTANGSIPGTPTSGKEPPLKKETSWREHLLRIGKRRKTALQRQTCLNPVKKDLRGALANNCFKH